MKRSVTFVIPAFNEERHIDLCLQSIQQLDLPLDFDGIKIIVVDNCSIDRTVEISYAKGAIVEQVPPGHPSRARNVGAYRSTGEWIAFVDADCELPTNWLTTCAAHLMQDEQIIAVAGAMSGPASDATWVEHAWYEISHAVRPSTPTSVRWLPTFNMLVRRSAFESVGGFDEALSTCEDCDLGYRLATHGKLVLDGQIKVVHRGESRSLQELFRREAWRTRGNLQLALARPFDGLNWFSLLLPPCILISLLVALGGLTMGLFAHRPFFHWLSAVVAILVLITLMVFRKTMVTNPLVLSKQVLVFLTYLAGRAAGMVWSFQRVGR